MSKNKALWVFQNIKESVDALPYELRGRAWQIIVDYGFGESVDVENDDKFIQVVFNAVKPLLRLRGIAGSQNGKSNNPSGKKKAPNITPNIGANIAPNIDKDIAPNITPNIGANIAPNIDKDIAPNITPKPLITETETNNSNKKININTLFVIGSPMWNFPVELVPLAKKYWKDETIREIEKSNSDTIERQTSIEQLLIRYPSDKKTPKPEPQEFVLPDIRFANAWNDWMQYKTQKKEKYLFSSLPKVWNQLIKLSNGDPAQAQAVVDQSIANNYKGLFPLKTDKSTELKRKNAENAAALMEWMND